MNVFKEGNDAALSDLISSLMPHPDEVGEDNKIWVEYSNAFLKALAPLLVWRRDSKGLVLSAAAFSDEAKFEKIIDAAHSPLVPLDIRNALVAYLDALPGYGDIKVFDKGDPQFQTAEQQHGYRTMIFTKALKYLDGKA